MQRSYFAAYPKVLLWWERNDCKDECFISPSGKNVLAMAAVVNNVSIDDR